MDQKNEKLHATGLFVSPSVNARLALVLKLLLPALIGMCFLYDRLQVVEGVQVMGALDDLKSLTSLYFVFVLCL